MSTLLFMLMNMKWMQEIQDPEAARRLERGKLLKLRSGEMGLTRASSSTAY